MSTIDISIVTPGYRIANWPRIYDELNVACGKYTYEWICVGPDCPIELLSKPNFLFIKDFGSPSRCAQLAIEYCNGRLYTLLSDDGTLLENGIEQAIDLYDSLNNPKAQIVMRYREGKNFSGEDMPDTYWLAHSCDLLRNLVGIKPHYLLAPVGMQSLEYMKYLGGLDCRFHHINLNCADLSYRIKEDGGSLHLSPISYLSCDWNTADSTYEPISTAFRDNDFPLLQEIYSVENAAAGRIRIPLENWKDSPDRWARFK